MGVGARIKRAGKAVTVLIGTVALLGGTIRLHAQGGTATTSLILEVRPEELLQVQSGGVLLKIRLARGATAQLWTADACTSPSSQPYVIAASGIYSIPFSTLRALNSDGSRPSTQVCLVSSDNLLRDSLPVGISGAGDSSAVRGLAPLSASGSVSAAVPLGALVVTRAGSITWSSP
jgi:hypothetical protein